MFSFRFHLLLSPALLVAALFLCFWGAWSQEAPEEETLIAPCSVWKYDDTGTDLGTIWRDVTYDDSGWATGSAQLGYGDGDEATTISYGGDPNNKYPCYYFRHGFDVADPAAYESLSLRVLRDDGCVVYLNGLEVARSNMPSGEIVYSTWASSAIGGSDETTWHEFAVAVDLLVAGTNVVAVEVHQSSETSSDVSFDLELLGLYPPPPVPEVTLVSPADESLVNTTTVLFTCEAADDLGLLDATLYIGNQPQTVTFSGPAETDDAQISADQPNTNFGSSTAINVDGDNPHAHAVIKFLNMFGDASGQVPLGSSIVSATLQMECFDSGNTMRLYRLTEDWAEGEVTWNESAAGLLWTNPGADGAGSHADTPLDGDCPSTGWRTFDITLFAQEWSSGQPNYGVVLTDTGTDGVDFDTSESGNPPVLTVTYQTEWQPLETKPLSGTSDTVTFTTTLADQEDYVWNCLVTNTSGGQSWAPADFRLRVDANAPDQPVLVTPADGAAGIYTSPALEVTVSDPNGDSLDVAFYGRESSAASDFTIVVLPDTQKYSLSYPEIFTAQTQWIVAYAAYRNIIFVTHEGDIVDTWNSTLEWDRANTSMSLLDGVVPYGLTPGNHDQPTDYYNLYFPYTRYESEPWYGGHYGTTNDTNYQLFSAGGDDYIVLHLEYWPGDEVIAWASSVLSTHSDRKAIITTHGFLGASGERNVHGMGSTQYIWDGLVVPNDNVYFVLCGHVSAECVRTDIVNGREVHQLLADYQGRSNGGDGWLRIMRFAPAENKVYVETYSPWLAQYETDADSQFTLDFPMTDFSLIGTDTGVPSGGNASMIWPGLSLNTGYEWYVTVSDPSGRTQVGPTWSFTTTSEDTTPPLITDVAAVDVTQDSARITWTTDERADSLVEYGLDTTYGSQVSDDGLVTSHSITLTGLSSETTYHYRVSSKDSSGNASWSGDHAFTTLPVNDPPVAVDDAYTVDEDNTLSVSAPGVLSNDSDPEDYPLTAVLVSEPSCGTLSLNGDGSFSYTPNANFNGADSFTYEANDGVLDSNEATVTITINAVNDAPVAADDAYSLEQDNALAEPAPGVLGNDSDVDGDLLMAVVVSGPSNGSVTLNPDGSFTYTPNPGFSGTDGFSYVASDGELDSNEATVTITVNPVSYDAYVSQDPIVTYGVLGGDGIAGTTAAGDGLVQTITEAPNGRAGMASLQAEYLLHTTADPSRVTTLELYLNATWTQLDADDPLVVYIWDGTDWQNIAANIQDGCFVPASEPQRYVNADGDIRVLFTDTAPIRKEGKDTLTIDLLYAHIAVGPPDTEPPAAPTGLVATPGDTVVDLDWDDNAELDLDGYNVYRSNAEGGTHNLITPEPVSSSSYCDAGLDNGVTYYYKVSAVDFSGNESALSEPPVAATPTNQPPGAPTGLVPTPGNSLVTLEWDDNPESDISGYNVYRSTTSGGPYTNIGTADSSDYADSTVENGTTYYYVVTAVDEGDNESGNSNEASATPGEQQTVHVGDISMALETAGKNWKAVATVLIHDQNGAAQAGALVVGDWEYDGPVIQTGASGTTDADGNAVITSPPKKAKTGDIFTFVVTSVVLGGYDYAPDENVETQDSITVP